MTEPEFRAFLESLERRVSNDDGFQSLSFINRHHLSSMAEKYKRMMDTAKKPEIETKTNTEAPIG